MFGSIKYFSVIGLFLIHTECYDSDILKGLSFLVHGQSEKEANLKSGWDGCSGVVRLPARRCHCGTRYCSGVAFEFPPSGPWGSMTVSNRETNPSREVQASLKQRWCCTMKDRREINKLHGSSLKIVAVLGSVWRQSFIRPFLIFCMCNFDAVVSVRLFISGCFPTWTPYSGRRVIVQSSLRDWKHSAFGEGGRSHDHHLFTAHFSHSWCWTSWSLCWQDHAPLHGEMWI